MILYFILIKVKKWLWIALFYTLFCQLSFANQSISSTLKIDTTNSGTIADKLKSPVLFSQDRKKFNFALNTAGAVILDKSPSSAKGYSNLLNNDEDDYAIAPCSEEKWVVIGLSEDIVVSEVVIAQYEKYSSKLKHFNLSIATVFPSDQWKDLGTYQAKPLLGEQTFVIAESSAHSRYLKVHFITHYDNDQLCTVSQIKVHGTTVIASLTQELLLTNSLTREIRTQLSISDIFQEEEEKNEEEKEDEQEKQKENEGTEKDNNNVDAVNIIDTIHLLEQEEQLRDQKHEHKENSRDNTMTKDQISGSITDVDNLNMIDSNSTLNNISEATSITTETTFVSSEESNVVPSEIVIEIMDITKSSSEETVTDTRMNINSDGNEIDQGSKNLQVGNLNSNSISTEYSVPNTEASLLVSSSSSSPFSSSSLLSNKDLKNDGKEVITLETINTVGNKNTVSKEDQFIEIDYDKDGLKSSEEEKSNMEGVSKENETSANNTGVVLNIVENIVNTLSSIIPPIISTIKDVENNINSSSTSLPISKVTNDTFVQVNSIINTNNSEKASNPLNITSTESSTSISSTIITITTTSNDTNTINTTISNLTVSDNSMKELVTGNDSSQIMLDTIKIQEINMTVDDTISNQNDLDVVIIQTNKLRMEQKSVIHEVDAIISDINMDTNVTMNSNQNITESMSHNTTEESSLHGIIIEKTLDTLDTLNKTENDLTIKLVEINTDTNLIVEATSNTTTHVASTYEKNIPELSNVNISNEAKIRLNNQYNVTTIIIDEPPENISTVYVSTSVDVNMNASNITSSITLFNQTSVSNVNSVTLNDTLISIQTNNNTIMESLNNSSNSSNNNSNNDNSNNSNSTPLLNNTVLSNVNSTTISYNVTLSSNTTKTNISSNAKPRSVRAQEAFNISQCKDLLKYEDFHSKILLKLQQTTDTDVGSAAQDNVIKQLLLRIRSMELNYAIMEMYISQISDCYRGLLSEITSLALEEGWITLPKEKSIHGNISNLSKNGTTNNIKSHILGKRFLELFVSVDQFTVDDVIFILVITWVTSSLALLTSIIVILCVLRKDQDISIKFDLDHDS